MSLSRSLHKTSDWWVEIKISTPYSLYSFGPFNSHLEAEIARKYHLNDLIHKTTGDISTKIIEAHLEEPINNQDLHLKELNLSKFLEWNYYFMIHE